MHVDVIVIGAGPAGMICAAQAAQRGRRVLIIDHAAKIGERIRISGGGRCNFTNRNVGPENYLSQNPHFCRSALTRFSQHDFLAMVEARGIAWHEREHGQLFCNDSAQDIIDMLRDTCDDAGVEWAYPCKVQHCETRESGAYRFVLQTERGELHCQSLVVASGGLAIPKLGATPFGYQLAEQFGLPVIAPKPALVPLVLAPDVLEPLQPLSGNTLDATTSCTSFPKTRFRENVLLTHRGLSGPAILQISSYWQMQDYADGKKRPIGIDLLPDVNVLAWLTEQRRNKILLANLLAEKLPRKFSHEWCELLDINKPMHEFANHELESIAKALKHWEIMPSGTLGYAKAEVTLGGVDTNALSSKTMEVKTVPGLFFIGEVVDVTGWLGGYNFQWAWSSGWVAGQFA
ncbi:MAG: NAD(P)/FAD-dependent oxidoreductase [Formivibrio sp.]|nr:NAD(P)/FAD-dependent oxidoreductase [Formivibrio sp.]